MIEVLHKGKRVACHPRSHQKGKATTLHEHRPKGHRAYAEWTSAKATAEAAKIGPETVALVARMMAAKCHPEQGLRACAGILTLVKGYGAERVEAAARRGNAIGATTYGSIRSILEKGLDRQVLPTAPTDAAPIEHQNIRGRGYYH